MLIVFLVAQSLEHDWVSLSVCETEVKHVLSKQRRCEAPVESQPGFQTQEPHEA